MRNNRLKYIERKYINLYKAKLRKEQKKIQQEKLVDLKVKSKIDKNRKQKFLLLKSLKGRKLIFLRKRHQLILLRLKIYVLIKVERII